MAEALVRQIVTLAMAGFLLAACSEPRVDDASESRQLVSVALAGAHSEVAALLSELLGSARADPDSGELRGRLAMAYEVNGYANAALATYQQAEALDGDEFAWPYFGALLHGKRGDHAAALQSVDRALAIDDAYVPAWLWRGEWLLEQDRNDDAMAAYRRARELGGEDVSAAAGMARTLLRQGRPAEAAKILEPITGAFDYSYIHRLLGRAYAALGRDDEAGIAFARGRRDLNLIWLDPLQAKKNEYVVSYGGRLAQAEHVMESGQFRDAVKLLKELRDMRPDDPALASMLGKAYFRAGRSTSALRTLHRGLELDPDHYFLNLHIAELYKEAGDTDLALKHLLKAIAVIPERGRGHYLLASIYLEQGRYDEALTAIDTALGYGVKDPGNVLYTAGMIEFMQQRWPQAIERLEQAVGIDEVLTKGHVYLAISLAEMGRYQEANAALGRAERLGTDTGEVASARSRLVEMEAAARRLQ